LKDVVDATATLEDVMAANATGASHFQLSLALADRVSKLVRIADERTGKKNNVGGNAEFASREIFSLRRVV
jgi:hypothetical protein